MDNNTTVDEFRQIALELVELYTKKNADYGNSFEESINDFGISAALVRISDKYNRIKHLLKVPNTALVGESVEDTLKDLASYSIMTLLALKHKNYGNKQ